VNEHKQQSELQGRLLETMEKTNRRKHQRSPVRAGAIAALSDTKLGSIADISSGGLAFRYIGFDHEDDDFCITESPQVSIVNNGGFAMHNVSCKIIAVDIFPPNNPFSSVRSMQCRLQFIRLTQQQKAQLEYFIAQFKERTSSRQ
jgi:hypothetical protein